MSPVKKYISVAPILLLMVVSFAAGQQPAFVRVKKQQFVINGRPWYFIGTNMWYAGLLAVGGDAAKGEKRLERELDFLRAKGISTIRVLLGAEGHRQLVNGVLPVQPALQPRQGVFDEQVWHGLDFLLQQLGKRKMNAVFFFSNNWEWSGGFLQYLTWNGKIDTAAVAKKLSWDEYRDDVSRFYSCTECIAAYHRYIRQVLLRTNRLTGRKYINDPAIMAWELANEPRPMRPAADKDYTLFLRNTTALIRSIDKNHLITLGIEGEMGTETSGLYETVHRDKNVDYCTIHIWPKNWSWFKGTAIAESMDTIVSRGDAYISHHADIAACIGKPLVIEEFGLPRDGHSFDITSATRLRDTWYAAVFARWKKSAQAGGALAGVNFWSFGGEGRAVPGQVYWKEGDDMLGDPPMEEQGLNVVFDSDSSTWKIITSFIQKTNNPYGRTGRQ